MGMGGAAEKKIVKSRAEENSRGKVSDNWTWDFGGLRLVNSCVSNLHMYRVVESLKG